MLMGFLPFALTPYHLYMAVISWKDWPGYVKGAEFSVLDALTLAIYFSLPSTRHPLPFKLSMALYFLAVLFSGLQSAVPMTTLFACWQLARMFLVYTVVARASSTDPRVVPALLKGLAASLFLEMGYAMSERFAYGVLQTGGTVGGQNLLGLSSHLIVIPLFALLLADGQGWLPVAVVLAGIVIELLTVSRATIGLAGFAFVTVFALSALRRWTPRKRTMLAAGMASLALIAPLAVMSLETRFAKEQTTSYDERAAFMKAGEMMLFDHPLGVGANNYVVVANIQGYNKRAGVADRFQSDATNVHNVYLLIAAETGYIGLITFLFFLLSPLTVAFRYSWRARKDPKADLLLGLGVALLTVYIHSLFEWIFVTFQVQYLFALELGMIAGLAQQLGSAERHAGVERCSQVVGKRAGVIARKLHQRIPE